MKNKNDSAPTTLISLISAVESADGELMLFAARINGAHKSIIYVRRGDDEESCTVDMSAEDCKSFFEELCEYGISPEHLGDAVEDACRGRYI